MTESATLERPSDAGPPPEGIVRRWLMEIKLADREEENWRKEAKRVVEIYRNEKDEGGIIAQAKRNSFNILWANTEILAPAVYNSTPKPDVRRRFRDSDPIGKVVSEVLSRALSYSVDDCGLHEVAELSVIDYLLAGRAVMRVRYEAEVAGDVVQKQKVRPELVHWDDFRRGPGRTWREVPWIAFRHRLTRDEGVKRLGDVWKEVPLEECEVEDKDAETLPADAFKRGIAWEVWDREAKEVIWIAPSHKAKPLKVIEDPIGLEDFYPIPQPLYSLRTTGTLIPVPEFCVYEDQAKELERVTRRIQKLVEACRVRGVYNSVLSEIRNLLQTDSQDNELIGAENVAAIAASGGLDKNIWMMPIDTIASVLVQLYQQREQIKAIIYELTGISDILRGSSSASETARAQEIKSQFGTLRLQKRQNAVATFLRDAIRIMGEIIAEHFEPEALAQMTGIKLPSAQEKMMAQAQAQQLSATGQPIPEELQAVLMQPSWDEVTQILRSDDLRGYRVDIETDSTVQQQVVQEQRDITELLNGIVSFLAGVAPAVESGAMPVETAKALLLSAVRRFRLGNEVEDALSKLEAPKGPPPEVQKMQQELQKGAEQLRGEKEQLTAQKQQLSEQATTKSMQLAEREHAIALAEQQAAADRAMFDRDRQEFDTTRGYEDRLAKMQEADLSLKAGDKESELKATEGVLQKHTEAVSAMAQQSQEALAQMAQAIVQSNAQIAQSMAAIAGAVEKLAGMQMAPRKRVRGPDGSLVGVEIEGHGTVPVQ